MYVRIHLYDLCMDALALVISASENDDDVDFLKFHYKMPHTFLTTLTSISIRLKTSLKNISKLKYFLSCQTLLYELVEKKVFLN